MTYKAHSRERRALYLASSFSSIAFPDVCIREVETLRVFALCKNTRAIDSTPRETVNYITVIRGDRERNRDEADYSRRGKVGYAYELAYLCSPSDPLLALSFLRTFHPATPLPISELF